MEETNVFKTTELLHDLMDLASLPRVAALSGKAEKIIVNNISTRKTEIHSTVTYYHQEYVVESSGFLRSTRSNFKEQSKLDILNAASSNSLVRECLLEMYDDSICCFLINSTYSPEVAELIKTKQTQLNEKDQKQRLKDKQDFEPAVFQDLIIILLFVTKIKLAYQNSMDSVENLRGAIEFYTKESRYYFNKHDYNECEKVCNTIKGKIFQMSNDLKQRISESDRNSLIKELQVVVMNLVNSIFSKAKSSITEFSAQLKAYKKCEECIKRDFLPFYSEVKDDRYIKVMVFLGTSLLKQNQFGNCEKLVKELKQISKISDRSSVSIRILEEQLKSSIPVKSNAAKKPLLESLRNIGPESDDTINWGKCSNSVDFEKDIGNLLKAFRLK